MQCQNDQIICNADQGKSISNKNYYNLSQCKAYKYGAQKDKKRKTTI